MRAATDRLQRQLEDILTDHFGRPCAITQLHREPYIYSTSFALEDMSVELDDGTRLRLILKDLSATGLLDGASSSKPEFLYEPHREIETYARLLSDVQMGSPVCYGAVVDEAAGQYALVLEKVEALELYQIGDLDVWVGVAGWLAGMHGSAALEATSVRERNPYLISYNGDFYRRWLDRAKRFGADAGRAHEEPVLTVVGHGLDAAIERLAQSPRTFVHGEFYASNVLVGEGPAGRRVCPVDWEMAGVGPALLDLAALCTGWDDEPLHAIANGYLLACDREGAWPPDEEEFLALLRCCQLCLAVQWLGWAPHWTAPPEHARDWLAEAAELTDRILR